MPDSTVMILCGRAPRHLYVANRICQGANVVAVVHEAQHDVTAAKLLRLLKPSVLLGKTDRWLRDRRRLAGDREAKFFFGDGRPALDRPELVHLVPHINAPAVIRLVDDLRPDLIMVFGTTLIRPPLLGKGRLGMVNLHGGLSPAYRGADGTFWALYNGRPDEIGCTIHFIDAGIDTGKLIAHVCPAVHPQDDELTLFWRAVREAAEVYAEVPARLERGERLGRQQAETGRLYQVKDRRRRHERRLAAALAAGLLRNVDLPPRVRWFTQ
jgi:methionyl-tRNA formyltransferase